MMPLRTEWLYTRLRFRTYPFTRLAITDAALSGSLHPFRIRTAAMSTTASQRSSPKTRTYTNALELLDQLQANKTVTHGLFSRPQPHRPSTQPAKPNPKSREALNANAIPEMHSWLLRAGLTPALLSAPSAPLYVHVAGTKGKGSVTAMIASVLNQYPEAAGRVGAYLSPHLVSVRERIMLDGKPISRELFAKYFFELWDRLGSAESVFSLEAEGVELVGDAAEPWSKPFYFRFLTLLALHIFLKEGVRCAVIECGIGGEYDSTNVLPANKVAAAVITQLGIDHVAMLGETVEEIAWHKAGILKENVVGFTRLLKEKEGAKVMEVLRRRASEKGAMLVELRDDWVEHWEGVPDAAMRGPFQKYNMALAVAAARQCLLKVRTRFQGGFEEPDYALSSMPPEFVTGLSTASLRGRSEVLTADGVEWYLDGAHTTDSLVGVGKWFAQAAAEDDAVNILLFNQQDKDRPVEGLLEALWQGARSIRASEAGGSRWEYAFFSRNDEQPRGRDEPGRDLTVQSTAARFVSGRHRIETETFEDVGSALDAVRMVAQQAAKQVRDCRVLVTGSFHIVGAVLKTLEPEADN
jgi:folylpolyglutamate synthase